MNGIVWHPCTAVHTFALIWPNYGHRCGNELFDAYKMYATLLIYRDTPVLNGISPILIFIHPSIQISSPSYCHLLYPPVVLFKCYLTIIPSHHISTFFLPPFWIADSTSDDSDYHLDATLTRHVDWPWFRTSSLPDDIRWHHGRWECGRHSLTTFFPPLTNSNNSVRFRII